MNKIQPFEWNWNDGRKKTEEIYPPNNGNLISNPNKQTNKQNLQPTLKHCYHDYPIFYCSGFK